MKPMHLPTPGSGLAGGRGVDPAIDDAGMLQSEAARRSPAANGRRRLRIGEEPAA